MVAVVHAFSSSTWEVEGGGSTEQVPEQLRLHRETCVKKTKAEIEKGKGEKSH